MKKLRHTVPAIAFLSLAAAAPALAQETPPAEEPPAETAPAEVAPPVAEPPPPAAPAKKATPGVVTYDKGFAFTTDDEAFELKIVGRLQTRWELLRPTEGGDDVEELSHRFSLPRGRLTLEGQAHGVGYKFQTEFGKGFTFLRDYYLDVPLSGAVTVRAGQWKRPFSRQQITSSGNLQLVDRALTDKFFEGGRDIGVVVHNGYEKTKDGLEYAVGVFNGTGDAPTTSCTTTVDMMGVPTTKCGLPSNVPADIGPTVVGRVGWNSGGIKGYSESDLEGGPLRFGVGLSYRADLNQLAEGTDVRHLVDVDAIVKVEGLSLTGAFYVAKAGDADADIGFHVQGGYFLTPKRYELAARYAMVPESAGSSDFQSEMLLGFNWFSAGHALKWQSDVGYILHGTDVAASGKPDEVVFRTQAQIVF